jgi:hypothetical protein
LQDKRVWYLTLVVIGLVLSSALTASADGGEDKNTKPDDRWFLTVYGGVSAQKKLGDVLTFTATFPDETYVGVAALAKEVWRYQQWVSLEAEGQVGRFFGKEDQWQFNGLLIGRWHPFPWDKYLDSSLAVGNGVSYNTEISEVERRADEDAGRILNYLLFELALGLPKHPKWHGVVRLHHRSSIKGLVGAGASNYVCVGIKFEF